MQIRLYVAGLKIKLMGQVKSSYCFYYKGFY